MRQAVVNALVYQFCTLKGIVGLICAVITGIGIYSLIRGHLVQGILLLVASQVLLLRLEIAEIAGKK